MANNAFIGLKKLHKVINTSKSLQRDCNSFLSNEMSHLPISVLNEHEHQSVNNKVRM